MSVEVKMFSLNSNGNLRQWEEEACRENGTFKTLRVSLFDIFIKVTIVKVFPTHFSFELLNALRLELLSHFTVMKTKPRP